MKPSFSPLQLLSVENNKSESESYREKTEKSLKKRERIGNGVDFYASEKFLFVERITDDKPIVAATLQTLL